MLIQVSGMAAFGAEASVPAAFEQYLRTRLPHLEVLDKAGATDESSLRYAQKVESNLARFTSASTPGSVNRPRLGLRGRPA